TTTTPPKPINGATWLIRRFGSRPGGAGNGGNAGGVCIMRTLYAFPTPGVSARSRGRREPLAVALFREQALRKIYPLRQFRHLVTQLLQLLEHRVRCRRAARRPGAAPQRLGDSLGYRAAACQ